MEVTDPIVELAGRWANHLLCCHIANLPSWVIKAMCHTELRQLRYRLVLQSLLPAHQQLSPLGTARQLRGYNITNRCSKIICSTFVRAENYLLVIMCK